MENAYTSEGVPGRYWHALADGRIQCDLCPRECKLHDGQRGLCFVRVRTRDQIVLTTYGRSSGFCLDPIEKKPLNHFQPGTTILSFGTAGDGRPPGSQSFQRQFSAHRLSFGQLIDDRPIEGVVCVPQRADAFYVDVLAWTQGANHGSIQRGFVRLNERAGRAKTDIAGRT
jgi:hypothetical protein